MITESMLFLGEGEPNKNHHYTTKPPLLAKGESMAELTEKEGTAGKL